MCKNIQRLNGFPYRIHEFIGEIEKQLVSSRVKAVITSTEISSTVLEAVNKSIPGARVIIVNDYIKQIPAGTIPFDVCDNFEYFILTWNPPIHRVIYDTYRLLCYLRKSERRFLHKVFSK